jgi:hypothetical protein
MWKTFSIWILCRHSMPHDSMVIVAEVPGFNNQERLPSSDIQFLTPTASTEVPSFITSSPEVRSTVPAKGIDSSQIHVMKPLH